MNSLKHKSASSDWNIYNQFQPTMYSRTVAFISGLIIAYATRVLGIEAGYKTNSTYFNPTLPGFHPDPSCIFVSDWDDTFFCASSSFNAFPGIPIHASKDLQSWKLVG